MQMYDSIILDLLRPCYETVYAAQDDSLTRGVIATLTQGATPWTPPAGAVAAVEVRKPDGTICVYDTLEDEETAAVTVSGSTATIRWCAEALRVSGVALAAVRFYTEDGERLSTFSFRLRVPEGAAPDAQVESTDYFNLLTRQIAALLGATTHPPVISPTTHNWMLWDEDTGQYEDSGYSSVGEPGPPSIPTATVSYQAGASPSSAPTGTWLDSPPTVPAGQYLWTRVVLAFEDSTTATYYSVARQGIDGSGSVSSVNSVSPDNNGNVALSASSIPTADSSTVQARLDELALFALTVNISAASTVQQIGSATDERISASTRVIRAEIADPAYQTGDWTVTTSAYTDANTANLTISGTCSAITTVLLILGEVS